VPTKKPLKQSLKKPAKKRSAYNDHELCADIAGAELTTKAIAAKHGISVPMVYSVTIGRVRPELKAEIEALVDAGAEETKRVFKKQARLLSLRLLSLAMNKDASGQPLTERNLDISLKATLKALEFAGLSVEPVEAQSGNKNMSFTVRCV